MIRELDVPEHLLARRTKAWLDVEDKRTSSARQRVSSIITTITSENLAAAHDKIGSDNLEDQRERYNG